MCCLPHLKTDLLNHSDYTMRFLLFFLVTATLAACSPLPEQQNVSLNGELENLAEEAVELNFFRDHINNDRKVITLDPEERNRFSASFDVPHPLMGAITTDREHLEVFLEPGYFLNLKGDARQLSEVHFSGSGSQVNNFFRDYQNEMEARLTRPLLQQKARDLDPVDYIFFADSIAGEKTGFLQSYPQSAEFSSAFLQFFETRVIYERFQKLLDYPEWHRQLNNLDEKPTLPEGYYDFLDEATRFDGDRLNNITYVNFLLSYLDQRRQKDDRHFPEEESRHAINYELAADYLSGRSKYYIQALSVSREMNSGDLELALELYNDFLERSPVEAYKEKLKANYDALQPVMPGNPAPDFTMTDIHGEEVSLSDYHGKVVYLKFWASWCGPCMREVPPAAELKERMKLEDDLVFMYVSIDTDPDAWRNAVERNDITGLHFNTPGRERGVPAQYRVRWIPTFFIIGRDGNILDNRPPKPSEPGIDDALIAALKETEI